MSGAGDAVTKEDVVNELSALVLDARSAFAALAKLLERLSESPVFLAAGNGLVVEQIDGAAALATAMRAKLKHAANELDEAKLRQRQIDRGNERPAT